MGHKRLHNTAHMRCMLDKQGYMHAHAPGHARARTHTHTQGKKMSFIALPRLKWLRERASLLRYTYIACLGNSKCSAVSTVHE